MKVIFMFPMMGGLTLLLQLAVVVVMVTATATTNHPLTESFVTAADDDDDIHEPLRHPNAYQVRTAGCFSRHVVDKQTHSNHCTNI